VKVVSPDYLKFDTVEEREDVLLRCGRDWVFLIDNKRYRESKEYFCVSDIIIERRTSVIVIPGWWNAIQNHPRGHI
jgi:hypothetical protein